MIPKRTQDMNILVVDDEEKICELIKIFLESTFQFRSIVIASTAAQASQKFANQDFDLIIIDHVMPGKAGIDFIHQLRNSVKYHKVKVVLISGYLEEEHVLNAIDAGIKHIIVKPFTRQYLVNQVADILKLDLEEKAS